MSTDLIDGAGERLFKSPELADLLERLLAKEDFDMESAPTSVTFAPVE